MHPRLQESWQPLCTGALSSRFSARWSTLSEDLDCMHPRLQESWQPLCPRALPTRLQACWSTLPEDQHHLQTWIPKSWQSLCAGAVSPWLQACWSALSASRDCVPTRVPEGRQPMPTISSAWWPPLSPRADPDQRSLHQTGKIAGISSHYWMGRNTASSTLLYSLKGLSNAEFPWRNRLSLRAPCVCKHNLVPDQIRGPPRRLSGTQKLQGSGFDKSTSLSVGKKWLAQLFGHKWYPEAMENLEFCPGAPYELQTDYHDIALSTAVGMHAKCPTM